MTSLALLGWTLARPLALVALLLPVALFLLSFRRQSPRSVVIGTLRFFRDEEAEASAQTRRRLSKSRWAAIVAMLFGAAAAVGPRPEPGTDPPEVFVVWVDRSPSMYLPLDPLRPGGQRRIDAAVESVRAWLGERARGGRDVLVRWSDASDPEPNRQPAVALDESPREGLMSRPRVPAGLPVWSALDRPGALLVTDAAPATELRHAGLFTSGGAAVPGPVAAGADGLHVWTGDDAGPLEIDGAGARPTVRITGPVGNGRFDEFIRLWAEERGVQVLGGAARGAARGASRGIGGDPVLGLLVHRSVAGPGGAFLEAGRDGWSATFAVLGTPRLREGLEPWLVAPDGTPLVGVRKGDVTLYFSGFISDPDEPAAFAVSWSGLLDGALLPPPEVITIDERRAAGSARSLPPGTPPVREPAQDVVDRVRDERGRRAETWLAALAALAGLAAFVLRLRGSP